MTKNYFLGRKVVVDSKDYAVVKVNNAPKNSFAVIKDKKETTAIVDEKLLSKIKTAECEKGWKLITFDFVIPFGVIGFMAKVAKKMADRKISIMAYSSFSTDHILVKKKHLKKAEEVLAKMGFEIFEIFS